MALLSDLELRRVVHFLGHVGSAKDQGATLTEIAVVQPIPKNVMGHVVRNARDLLRASDAPFRLTCEHHGRQRVYRLVNNEDLFDPNVTQYMRQLIADQRTRTETVYDLAEAGFKHTNAGTPEFPVRTAIVMSQRHALNSITMAKSMI